MATLYDFTLKRRSDILICELLFEDDTALVSKSIAHLQKLVNRFAQADRVLVNHQPKEDKDYDPSSHCALSHHHWWATDGDGTGLLDLMFPSLWILTQYWMGGLQEFVTIPSLQRILNCEFNKLVSHTLLYGSKTWTTYRTPEKWLNSFHLRYLRCILHIHWQDRITNSEVLECAGIPSIIYTLSLARGNSAG